MITITPTLHFNHHTPVRAILHVDNDESPDTDGMSLEVTARNVGMLKAQANQLRGFLIGSTTHEVKVKSVINDYDNPFLNKEK